MQFKPWPGPCTISYMHTKTICKECGDVISQCRCKDDDKMIIYDTCDKCKKEKNDV
jgi:hypothetical protein